LAKRDPEKTQRNKVIAELSEKVKELLPDVLEITGFKNEHSLNAKYGGKNAEFIDLKHEVIQTPEQYITLWVQGYHRKLEELGENAREGISYYDNFTYIRDYEVVFDWLMYFLRRTFLRNFEALSKVRPNIEEAVLWIGQENASYGLLVTPRFKKGQWENDKSEIRHFKPNYWTIGHILETGLVVPFENEKIEFSTTNEYLSFFKNTIVRASGSVHEKAIAKRYCDYVKNQKHPEQTPLLIPEFRYNGIEKKHIYRLDFTIINPFTMNKVGFELSPWSTHGKLTGIKGKTQKKVNEEAQANFEKEMKKLKSFFRKFGITTLVYTDTDLEDYDSIFEEIEKYLNTQKSHVQLEFQAVDDFLKFESPKKA